MEDPSTYQQCTLPPRRRRRRRRSELCKYSVINKFIEPSTLAKCNFHRNSVASKTGITVVGGAVATLGYNSRARVAHACVHKSQYMLVGICSRAARDYEYH
ncbi:hypothetical protein JYU34_004614 [Plutella xylostella]|uniref:Uncharacterized protein n=1 Tax=Plutella xylostella TaxID=51655 RepID=A0ABQ7QYE8_PLUXY|nr:hypothetical protein JYU34_004614 [Plutella xylostella]